MYCFPEITHFHIKNPVFTDYLLSCTLKLQISDIAIVDVWVIINNYVIWSKANGKEWILRKLKVQNTSLKNEYAITFQYIFVLCEWTIFV